MPQRPKKPVNGIVKMLLGVSDMVRKRMDLKEPEQKRVTEAFTLLVTGEPPANAKGAKQGKSYLGFLQRINTMIGLPMVVLCAVGLGKSAVVNMKDNTRVELCYAMKEKKDDLDNDVLQNISKTYAAKFFPGSHSDNGSENALKEVVQHPRESQVPTQEQGRQPQALTGDVYQLMVEANQEPDTPDTIRHEEIDYRYSEAPVDLMPLLGNLLFSAVAQSNKWKCEREVGGVTTNCMSGLVPANRSQDISITLSVGHEKGLKLIETLNMLRSSSP